MNSTHCPEDSIAFALSAVTTEDDACDVLFQNLMMPSLPLPYGHKILDNDWMMVYHDYS
jgi:hypothetical protein